MASSYQSGHNYISRDEMKQKKALEEARKMGRIPAEKDAEGKDINPHMPQYITVAPWYLNQNQPSLNHQKFFQKAEKQNMEKWYARGQKGYQATQFRKGACENCGASTHKTRDCFERPRKQGAKVTGQDIAPDDIIVNLDLDYDGKRDRWNGYEPEDYDEVIREHEAFDNQRKKRKVNQEGETGGDAGQGEGGEGGEGVEGEGGDGEGKPEKQQQQQTNEDENLDEEYKQSDFDQAQNVVQVKRDPKTKSIAQDLRIREDVAKYLLNRDKDSAYFDPKSRALRDNPNPHLPEELQTFKGDGSYKYTGDTIQFHKQEKFVWDMIQKTDKQVNIVTDPTQLELEFKKEQAKKDVRKSDHFKQMVEKYGGEEHIKSKSELVQFYKEKVTGEDEQILREGQAINSEKYHVDTKKRAETTKKSKYPEDIFIMNHKSVWGSWWNEVLGWGFSCCHDNDKYSQCQGEKGKGLAVVREYKIRKQREEKLQELIRQEEEIHGTGQQQDQEQQQQQQEEKVQ